MSLFSGAANAPGKSLFGNVNTTANQQGTTGGLFNTAQPQQGSSLFGTQPASSQATGTSLFGGGVPTAKPPGSVFGGSTMANSIQQGPSLFGGSTTAANSQPAPSLFGGSTVTANSQQPSTLFGTTTATGTSTVGQQPALSNLYTRSGGLFGGLAQPTQNQPNLFGQAAVAGRQNTQVQSSVQHTDSLFESLQTSRIWNENDVFPPQKNVQNQIMTCWRKWDPNSPNSVFQTYLYNNVGADAAPFYRPGSDEDEQKWEDALAKAPSEGLIPVSVRGFQDLGKRIVNQTQYFNLLQGRLHEINNGLSELLRRHDLEVSARAAECRRRHVRLSQKCLNLATKTQILRNRGYALDSAEEELAQKLRRLERQVLDPALSGREEEIWARMVSLRERGRILQAELETNGGAKKGDDEGPIDEETLKRAKKILEDYDSQLTHLSKELESISTDFSGWAKERTSID